MVPALFVTLFACKAALTGVVYVAIKSDLNRHITNFIENIPADMICIEQDKSGVAELIRERYPLPACPERVIFPNNGRMISLPNGGGEFHVFAYTPAQGRPVVLAAGYDRQRRFRIVPIMTRGGTELGRTAFLERIAQLMTNKSATT
jgi:hypothetical protein